MPKRYPELVNEEIYHVFNRGVEKRKIFLTARDYEHFLETLGHYLSEDRKFTRRIRATEEKQQNNLVDMLCYVLMPNHFHILLKQRQDNGIATFLGRVQNSFTKYFNTKNDRVGPLLQGRFKAVRIEKDEQLLHISRYIHLNPIVSGLVDKLESYYWSSYPTYLGLRDKDLLKVKPSEVLNHFAGLGKYKEFVLDQVDYAKSLENLKHTKIE